MSSEESLGSVRSVASCVLLARRVRVFIEQLASRGNLERVPIELQPLSWVAMKQTGLAEFTCSGEAACIGSKLVAVTAWYVDIPIAALGTANLVLVVDAVEILPLATQQSPA